jgi:hypothetical protein
MKEGFRWGITVSILISLILSAIALDIQADLH